MQRPKDQALTSLRICHVLWRAPGEVCNTATSTGQQIAHGSHRNDTERCPLHFPSNHISTACKPPFSMEMRSNHYWTPDFRRQSCHLSFQYSGLASSRNARYTLRFRECPRVQSDNTISRRMVQSTEKLRLRRASSRKGHCRHRNTIHHPRSDQQLGTAEHASSLGSNLGHRHPGHTTGTPANQTKHELAASGSQETDAVEILEASDVLDLQHREHRFQQRVWTASDVPAELRKADLERNFGRRLSHDCSFQRARHLVVRRLWHAWRRHPNAGRFPSDAIHNHIPISNRIGAIFISALGPGHQIRAGRTCNLLRHLRLLRRSVFVDLGRCAQGDGEGGGLLWGDC